MLISYLLPSIFSFFHSFVPIIQSDNDFAHPSNIHPSVHLSVRPSIHPAVSLQVGRGWGCFVLTGLLFHKINKWYLRSGVESITNGSWRKGNLGRSARAGEGTEWVFTVKYNQCITKHIRGLLKKPSTPHSPLWKWPTLSWPTWLGTESHFQKVRGEGFIALALRNGGAPGEWQSKRWSFFNSPTYIGADKFHDTWRGVTMEW